MAWEADATGFDPGFSRGIQAYYLEGNIFNPLVIVDEQLNFVPELTESWEAQENSKVYAFMRGFKKRFETVWLDK